ncbi:MAG: response regulator [Bacteroidales bacterium]|nr:response regulator [Bacteroidales bacterium]
MKRFLLLSILLFVALQTTFAQIDSVDYYYNLFAQSKGNERVVAADKLFAYLDREEFTDTTYIYANADTTDMQIAVLSWVGTWYYYDNNFDKSVYYNQIALDLCRAQNNTTYLGDVLNTLAISLQVKGDFPHALVYQTECYKLDSISGNLANLSSSLSNLAALYLAIGQPKAAERFILEAIDTEKQLNRGDKMAIRLGMASEIYMKMNNPHESYRFAYQAYQIDSAEHRDAKAAVRLSQLSETYIALDSLSKAEKILRKAIPLIDSAHNYHSLAICYIQMGRINQHRGDNEAAAKYYTEALQLTKKTGNSYNEKNACRGLAASLKETDPALALKYLERYTFLADSMYREETAIQLSHYSIKYETDKLQLINEEKVKENHRIVITTLVILISMIIIILGLIYIIKIKTRSQQLTKKIQQLREEFFTNITHEFRTPLTVILGLARRLQKDESEAKASGERIERQGNRLLTLINSLLDISKIKSAIDPPKLQKGDIVVNIRMIVEGLDYYANEKHIALGYRPRENTLITMIEPEYLQKIVSNLVANAIKYTPEYGRIDVTSRFEDKNFVLSVSDTGKGIKPEHIPHIFDTFYRAGETDPGTGTGVGLSLVKICTEALGGNVSVSSDGSNGTTFTVKLPVKELFDSEEKALIAGIAAHSSPDSQCDILIIEDDSDISYFIGSELNSMYNVTYAFNGEDGYEKAVQTLPDIIITDVKMPGMDGYTLTKKVRENGVTSHIPVIMVTAKTNIDDKIRGIEAGADAYLYKPFNSEELLSTIKTILDNYRRLRQKFAIAATTDEPQAADNQPESVDNAEQEEKSSAVSVKNQEFILKLNDKIVSAMHNGRPDVESLASDMCMSRSQLNRKIIAVTGMNPTAYIIQMRIGIAKSMLDNDILTPIGDIAMKCGFDDVSYFSRVFKQICGITPTQYRKKN